MTMKGETKLVRIRKSTHKKIRLLAAEFDMTLTDTIEKIAAEALSKIKKESGEADD